jgi:hypothetical protein
MFLENVKFELQNGHSECFLTETLSHIVQIFENFRINLSVN